MPFHSAALSDRGRMRPQNEDSFLESPERSLFAVADGMGGHAAGEVASHLAIEVLERTVAETSTELTRAERLWRAVAGANDAIIARADEDTGLAGMGTTLTVVLADGPSATVAHVGDSRLYRLRSGRLECLTSDHTVVQRYVDVGQISEVQARTHPMRHILTRALGMDEDLEVDVFEETLEEGDLLLLCSDGLTGMVDDDDLEAVLSQSAPLEDLARQLVEGANARGGEDNITVVLVRVE